MKNITIISTLNTNTNTNSIILELENDATVLEALNKACAQCFFQNVEAEDLVHGIVTYNGFDADVMGDSIAEAILDDDDELEVNVYGECRTAAAEERIHTANAPISSGVINITVALAGGITTLAKIIEAGTTIDNLYDSQISNFFGGITKCQYDNMQKYVNDVEVDNDYEIEEGDNITLAQRKAGTKGVGTIIKLLGDNTKSVTLASGIGDEGALVVFNTVHPAASGYKYIIIAHGSDGSIVLKLVPVSFDDPCSGNCNSCTGCDDDEDEDDFYDEDEDEEEEDPEDGTVGSVEVWLPGGLSSKNVPIVSGKTTLRDVVTANSMLALTGASKEQAENYIYSINDCEADLDDYLEANDTITMAARAAGAKGC